MDTKITYRLGIYSVRNNWSRRTICYREWEMINKQFSFLAGWKEGWNVTCCIDTLNEQFSFLFPFILFLCVFIVSTVCLYSLNMRMHVMKQKKKTMAKISVIVIEKQASLDRKIANLYESNEQSSHYKFVELSKYLAIGINMSWQVIVVSRAKFQIARQNCAAKMGQTTHTHTQKMMRKNRNFME